MYITLSEAKRHLNIDDEYTLDDEYIISLIQTAENAVAKKLDRPFAALVQQDGTIPPTVKHSVLLLTGTLYSQRESVAPIQLHTVPHTLDWLLGCDKHYHIVR